MSNDILGKWYQVHWNGYDLYCQILDVNNDILTIGDIIRYCPDYPNQIISKIDNLIINCDDLIRIGDKFQEFFKNDKGIDFQLYKILEDFSTHSHFPLESEE